METTNIGMGGIKQLKEDMLDAVRLDYRQTLSPYIVDNIRCSTIDNITSNMAIIQNAIDAFIRKHNLPINMRVESYGPWGVHIYGADWVSDCIWYVIGNEKTLESIINQMTK